MRLPYAFVIAAMIVVPLLDVREASAWGCVAEASNGASGWSNNFDDEADASDRALRECYAKSNGDDCEITDCNIDW